MNDKHKIVNYSIDNNDDNTTNFGQNSRFLNLYTTYVHKMYVFFTMKVLVKQELYFIIHKMNYFNVMFSVITIIFRYAYTHTCTHTNIYVCVYTHTHTHTE